MTQTTTIRKCIQLALAYANESYQKTIAVRFFLKDIMCLSSISGVDILYIRARMIYARSQGVTTGSLKANRGSFTLKHCTTAHLNSQTYPHADRTMRTELRVPRMDANFR